MKKLSIFIFAIIVSLGGLISVPAFTDAVDGDTTVERTVSSVSEFTSVINSADENTLVRLMGNLNFNNQQIQIDKFNGVLDGNGYTISNFTVTSGNHNYGLVNNLSGGRIENLKISGDITYDFSPSSTTPVNVGTIVGLADSMATIQNCEIVDVQYHTRVNGEIKDDLQFVTQFTFGGIAGALVDEKSTITSCINHADVNLYTSLSATNVMRVGGIVGRLHDGWVGFCNVSANISFAATSPSTNLTFYNGGIIGEVEGSNTKAYNLTYEGEIKRRETDNYAKDFSGAVAGNISSLANKTTIEIANAYWTKMPEGQYFGQESEYVVDESKVRKVDYTNNRERFPRAFYTSDNWHKRYGDWDFDYTWIMKDRLHLQYFETFSYSLASYLDADNSGVLSGGSIGETYKYGAKVTINLQVNSEFKNFYELKQVLLNSNPISDYDYIQTSEGYQVTLDANDKTDGSYSFKMEAIPFKCYAVTSDINKGGVRRSGDRTPIDRVEMNLTYARTETQRQTIVSATDSSSIYTPSYWDLYYLKEGYDAEADLYNDEAWEVAPANSFPDSQNAQISFMFGQAPFNRSFKLVANYTDEKALMVNVRGDDNITSIKFLGEEIPEGGRRTSPTLDRAPLVVTVKEGYELDLERLKSVIAALYGNNNTGTLIPSSPQPNEQGEMEYTIYVNMRQISSNNPTNLNIAINLYSVLADKEEGDSLLWLWITLPIVVVLIVVGIVLFFVLRRYRYMNAKLKKDNPNAPVTKKKKETEKKADYKDFYY